MRCNAMQCNTIQYHCIISLEKSNCGVRGQRQRTNLEGVQLDSDDVSLFECLGTKVGLLVVQLQTILVRNLHCRTRKYLDVRLRRRSLTVCMEQRWGRFRHTECMACTRTQACIWLFISSEGRDNYPITLRLRSLNPQPLNPCPVLPLCPLLSRKLLGWLN